MEGHGLAAGQLGGFDKGLLPYPMQAQDYDALVLALRADVLG